MAVPFAISDSVDDDVAWMALAGEVDLSVVAALRGHVGGLLARDSVRGVMVDLTAVTFVDSSGIGELVRCRGIAEEAGKWLRVVHAQGRVAAVLDLSGVTDYLAG